MAKILEGSAKLYENIVIGNFLYMLGFSLAKKISGDAILPVVNLLQQTPDDARLADIFMASKSTVLILEFKRKENTDGKEELKLQSLERAIRHKSRMKEISRAMHWFIESELPSNQLFTKITPYLDAYETTEKTLPLPDFLEKIATALLDGIPNLENDESLAYLGLLTACNGVVKRAKQKKHTDDKGKDGAGAAQQQLTPQSHSLILQVTANGGLSYVDVASYGDLTTTRRELFRRLEQRLKLEQDHGKRETLDMKKSLAAQQQSISLEITK